GTRWEAGHPVWTDRLGGVHVGGGRDLHRVLPPAAHQSALAPGALVVGGLLLVLDDRGPRVHRVGVLGACRPPQFHEPPTDVGVAHPGRGVGVPGEGRAARAPPWFVAGKIVADVGVIGLLRLPRDDPLLDVDLPRARARAVDAVGGADHLVVTPAVAVEHVRFTAAGMGDRAQVLRGLAAAEEPAGAQDRVGGGTVEPGGVAAGEGAGLREVGAGHAGVLSGSALPELGV